ncbi:MAG: DUF58 domain-containing protein [Candidatus Microthrix sp.]|nr:DUF58 domain-containing protein [Candidatus Microthrix sp.]
MARSSQRPSATGPDRAAPGPLAGRRTQEVLRRLELNVNRRLDGILHGEYRGLVPGHGSEPGETRIYAPGDDTRRIDWNVTARMQTPHIARRSPTASWKRGCASTSPPASTLAPHLGKSGTWRWPPPPGSASSPHARATGSVRC